MTTPPPKPKRTRRSQLTITGTVYPYDPKHANPNHPLAHLTREERWDELYLALGNLILNAIEDDRREAAKVAVESAATAEQR